jgi:hypothetical protein
MSNGFDGFAIFLGSYDNMTRQNFFVGFVVEGHNKKHYDNGTLTFFSNRAPDFVGGLELVRSHSCGSPTGKFHRHSKQWLAPTFYILHYRSEEMTRLCKH